MTIARAFGDPKTTPDDFTKFSQRDIDADTQATWDGKQGAVPTARSTDPMELADVIGAAAVARIQASGKIAFHTVGDTGGIHKPEYQFAVADAMSAANDAAFFYHLGDVVYYFGQEQYYFEQFYDPYRDYQAPIFAIPGNHDGAVFTGEGSETLAAFKANFCAPTPGVSPQAQGTARTTMDQPGVYFTLNAPFVKIVGMYSNTSEGGTSGIIAGPNIGNAQLDFLDKALAQAKAERDAGKGRALVIATHHPPFTGSPSHAPSPGMLASIDQACSKAGIWPDLYLSGHAHLYERYTRTVHGKQIPYVVAGMGGFYNLAGLKPNAPPAPQPASGLDASGNPLRLEVFNGTTFGYMKVEISATSIDVAFVTVDPATGKTGTGDSFSVGIGINSVVKPSTGGATSQQPTTKQPTAKKPTTKKPTAKTAPKKAAPPPAKKAPAKKAAKKVPAKSAAKKRR